MMYSKDQLSVFCYFCSALMTDHGTPRLFVDDTCFVINSPNEILLKSEMNIDLLKLTRWLRAKKLTINPTNSNILIIPPQTTMVKLHVSRSLTRHLGVTFDGNLKFNQYIIDIEYEVSKGVGIISKLPYFMPQKVLLHVSYALVHPHL